VQSVLESDLGSGIRVDVKASTLPAKLPDSNRRLSLRWGGLSLGKPSPSKSRWRKGWAPLVAILLAFRNNTESSPLGARMIYVLCSQSASGLGSPEEAFWTLQDARKYAAERLGHDIQWIADPHRRWTWFSAGLLDDWMIRGVALHELDSDNPYDLECWERELLEGLGSPGAELLDSE
jgi:hypothetical protein